MIFIMCVDVELLVIYLSVALPRLIALTKILQVSFDHTNYLLFVSVYVVFIVSLYEC